MTRIIHRAENPEGTPVRRKRLEEEFGREKADEIIRRESTNTISEFDQPLDGSSQAISVEHALEAARKKNPVSAPEPERKSDKESESE